MIRIGAIGVDGHRGIPGRPIGQRITQRAGPPDPSRTPNRVTTPVVVSTDGVPATGVLGVSATAVIGTLTVPAALEYVPLAGFDGERISLRPTHTGQQLRLS